MKWLCLYFAWSISKRDIPAINYVMHQTHCVRNIVLCKKCDEPVPRSEMEAHNEEYHVLVSGKFLIKFLVSMKYVEIYAFLMAYVCVCMCVCFCYT